MIANTKPTSKLAQKWQLIKTAVMRCFSKFKRLFRNRKYDVYCPYCSSCGETGCCSPTTKYKIKNELRERNKRNRKCNFLS